MQAVQRFRSLLRIPTVASQGPSGPYAQAADLLCRICSDLDLAVERHELVAGKPICIVKWPGLEPSLPAILLNAHYDVVPAQMDLWTVDPFAAEHRADGQIVGRGAQDMKCVCIQYLEAVARLKKTGRRFKRTVYVSLVPDEEIGGGDGMQKMGAHLVPAMNVGMALDEGTPREDEYFNLFYAERLCWWVCMEATGPPGHASRFIKETAVEKILAIANRMMSVRAQEEAKLTVEHSGCEHGRTVDASCIRLGDVMTTNLTALRAGVVNSNGSFALNVIPHTAEAYFDIRLPVTVDLAAFKLQLESWAAEAGVVCKFVSHYPKNPATSIDPAVNPYWPVLKGSLENQGLRLLPSVCTVATDSRTLRGMDIPCFGFSPINNTVNRMHENDEMLHESVFLRGIDIYARLLEDLLDMPFSHLEIKAKQPEA
eukprot:gnl/Hemi2/10274_TR3543_c0_g1_i1.p1 gnl/Hemi2/10274_TR3543_c0_g1~~gnl/Hemi2/10274_TR3543_c0_g1_i1.p1  ORF type:complete len:427 (-),score=40.42 gnl/Hemi2/10274_TR3543_c0_g1_i1:68-1348(-)